jgi:putative ABC transport system ATP-binding protein
VIRVRDLDFGYPRSGFRLTVPALDIAAGEQVALIGPSGCGKTSLLALLCGILRPTAGSIRFGDTELTTLSESARRALRIRQIGLVFQEFELLEYLCARDNILLPFRLSGRMPSADPAGAALAELAQATGIENRLNRFPKTLSHGEKQRVALCRALVTRPRLVAADEPTGSLDPTTARAALDLLQTTARQVEATLLVVTHNHDMLAAFDRVIDMQTWNGESAR